MAIPEGYEKLAAIGIAYQGEYKGGTAYKLLHAVYYSGSTYVALKDNPSAPPAADNTNWMYLAKGFTEGVMSAINAADASGILGTAGEEVNAQTLIDAIAARAVDSILQNKIVNNLLATDPATVLAGTQGKALDTRVTELTRKLSELTMPMHLKVNITFVQSLNGLLYSQMFYYPNADAHTFNIVRIIERNTGMNYSADASLFRVEKAVYGVQIWSSNARMAELLSGKWADITFDIV